MIEVRGNKQTPAALGAILGLPVVSNCVWALAIPGLRTVSESNMREHWAQRAKRVKNQRGLVRMYMSRIIYKTSLPRLVRLIRFGPRKLDSDNLSRALKAVRDQVAEQLGIDDGDERVAWCCVQERGPVGVTIEFWR